MFKDLNKNMKKEKKHDLKRPPSSIGRDAAAFFFLGREEKKKMKPSSLDTASLFFASVSGEQDLKV